MEGRYLQSFEYMAVFFSTANLKRSTLFLYECEEQSTLPELETMHSDLKLGMYVIKRLDRIASARLLRRACAFTLL